MKKTNLTIARICVYVCTSLNITENAIKIIITAPIYFLQLTFYFLLNELIKSLISAKMK